MLLNRCRGPRSMALLEGIRKEEEENADKAEKADGRVGVAGREMEERVDGCLWHSVAEATELLVVGMVVGKEIMLVKEGVVVLIEKGMVVMGGVEVVVVVGGVVDLVEEEVFVLRTGEMVVSVEEGMVMLVTEEVAVRQ